MTARPVPRVVFDTNIVISALVFAAGRLVWLRRDWAERTCIPLASGATVAELRRVLTYSKFRLSPEEQFGLLADYLPFSEIVDPVGSCPVLCRDPKDQPLLDLAHHAKADCLISGDKDLLVLAPDTPFVIETPEAFRRRVHGG